MNQTEQTDMTVAKYGEELETYKKELDGLNAARKKLLGIDQKYKVLSINVANKKSKKQSEIFEAVDDAGKKKYSNETQRSAALFEALNADQEYLKINKELEDFMYAKEETLVIIEEHIQNMRFWRLVIDTLNAKRYEGVKSVQSETQ